MTKKETIMDVVKVVFISDEEDDTPMEVDGF